MKKYPRRVPSRGDVIGGSTHKWLCLINSPAKGAKYIKLGIPGRNAAESVSYGNCNKLAYKIVDEFTEKQTRVYEVLYGVKDEV